MRRPRRARSTPATCLLAILLILAETASAAAFFAEPFSGRKVTEYTVELPVERGEYQTFSIPQQCDRIIRQVDNGWIFNGTVVDRRLWMKADGDCRFYLFLNRHPQPVIEDHLSGYDFRNAKLDDLLVEGSCPDGTPCDPLAADSADMLHALLEATTPVGEGSWQPTPCQLHNGVFIGRVTRSPDGLVCETSRGATGIRLIAVDFADVNGDRVLDAVLRLVPIGPGATRVPLVLPLTRLSPDSEVRLPGMGSRQIE